MRTVTPKEPAAVNNLTGLLTLNGWRHVTNQFTDGCEHPFITIEARKTGHPPVRATWHTHQTGGRSYRQFGILYGRRGVSYKTLLGLICEQGARP